jgi:hypothetical protein
MSSSNDEDKDEDKDESPATTSVSAKKDTTDDETANPDILKDRLNTLKRVFIYALFLFVKICCFIFINANLIYYFTYLFERIYYKEFTLGNSKKKKVMVEEFKKELDDLFPSDRTKYPYFKNQYVKEIDKMISKSKIISESIGLNIHDNPLLTCPPKPIEKPGGPAAAGQPGGFSCDKKEDGTCVDTKGASPTAETALPTAAAAGTASTVTVAALDLKAAAPPGGTPEGTPEGTPASAPVAEVASGEQKGGAAKTLITYINNLSKKILEGVKPVARVKKDITELYKGKGLGTDSGSGSGSEPGSVSDPYDLDLNKDDSITEEQNKNCADTIRKPVQLDTCEEVNCDTLPGPYGWKFPENFFGDYVRIRIACMGRSQIAIYHKVKNSIKIFNNFLPAFCYCSEEETKFISGYERRSGKDDAGNDYPKYDWADDSKKDKWFNDPNNKKVKRTELEKIETECAVLNDFYNGLYMIFGLFISILYLIYWDLYLNITLFINHILLFFEIKKAPETHIKTKYRRTLQFLMLMMSPFIFITNRVIAFIIMIQITYKLWVKPLLDKNKKKKVGKILLENKTIIAFMFVFSYLLLLYTIQLPPKYELPVKIIPTLVITIIVFIKVILAIYRLIKNYRFNQTGTCKKV